MTKTIYILALHGVRTGGPEAIAQLSDALISQGWEGRCKTVYYDWQQIAALERSPPSAGYQFGLRENNVPDYSHYQIEPAGEILNSHDAIIVLSETLCHLAPLFDKATVLIWWLSVDNGFGALSKINLNHLRKPNVYHAWQSWYASQFIDSLGFDNAGDLGDYVLDQTCLASPTPVNERPKLALFNANHKVIADLDAIFAEVKRLEPEIECRKLVGLSRDDVAKALTSARLYVDLGCFPGKDRLPREAATAGCAVLMAPCGAWEEIDDDYGIVTCEPSDPIVTARQIVALVRTPPPILKPEPGFERGGFFNAAKWLFDSLSETDDAQSEEAA